MASRIIICIIAVSMFAGCATKSIFELSVDELANSVIIDQSDFRETIVIRSINITQQRSQGSVLFVPQFDNENYFLRSIINRQSGELIAHQIYVSVSYRGDWRVYRSANILGGEILDFTQIDSNVISCADSELTGCRISEDFAVNLTQMQFTNATQHGLTFRANTRYSDRFNDYTLPASLFQAQAQVISNL